MVGNIDHFAFCHIGLLEVSPGTVKAKGLQVLLGGYTEMVCKGIPQRSFTGSDHFADSWY